WRSVWVVAARGVGALGERPAYWIPGTRNRLCAVPETQQRPLLVWQGALCHVAQGWEVRALTAISGYAASQWGPASLARSVVGSVCLAYGLGTAVHATGSRASEQARDGGSRHVAGAVIGSPQRHRDDNAE